MLNSGVTPMPAAIRMCSLAAGRKLEQIARAPIVIRNRPSRRHAASAKPPRDVSSR